MTKRRTTLTKGYIESNKHFGMPAQLLKPWKRQTEEYSLQRRATVLLQATPLKQGAHLKGS